MCTNYRPGSRDFVQARFGAPADFEYPEEAYPGALVPVVRARGAGAECVCAGFGLVPHWARDAKIARNTYNARAETVALKPSFRRAWRAGQFCLVPMRAFYEMRYDTGRPVRWRIETADGGGFAAAGIWEAWRAPDGRGVITFSLLTINADAHPLMRRYHRPGDEKRALVVIDPAQDVRWLHAGGAAAGAGDAGALLRLFDAQAFIEQPAPRAARAA